MDVPEWLVNALPVVGIIGIATSICYLYVMQTHCKNAYSMFYGFAVIDVVFSIGMTYAGFHGIILFATGDTESEIRPIACMSEALHITVWSYCDFANLLILSLLTTDQLISVIWSKRHSEVSSYYFKMPVVLLILILSFGIIVPTWHFSISTADNRTILVSQNCRMADVVYPWLYDYGLEGRKWIPLICLGGLFLTSVILLIFQLQYNWEYKWTDSNANAQQMFFFILLRCLLTICAIHIPIIMDNLTSEELSPQLANQRINKTEYFIRFSQSIAYNIIQPGLSVIFLPKYYEGLEILCNKYAHNTKRNWESADDPPVNKHQDSSDPVFGSWYSSAGNICGEAGLPIEFNPNEQRSVSFYYDEMRYK